MRESAVTLHHPTIEERSTNRALTLAVSGAFAVVAASLVWSRLAPLSHSLWLDEIVTVRDFVRPGPVELFFGDYTSNNHMLFTLLAWATTVVSGESEIAVRIWSAVPFIVAVAVAAMWLYRRWGAVASFTYAFLATQSPLLLDISPQARGYGLAYLAMTVMVIAACECFETPARLPIVSFCAAGLAGAWTLPVFVLPFAATSAVLLVDRRVRPRLALWLGVSAVAGMAWYLPVVPELLETSQLENGEQVPWHAGITGAFSLLEHSLSVYDESTLVSVGAYVVFGVPLAAGVWTTYSRSRSMLLVLAAGVVTTFAGLTMTRFFVLPRFISYLLVPIFILTAVGVSRLASDARGLRTPARIAVATSGALAFVWLAAVFVVGGRHVAGLPIEANREAALRIEQLPSTSPVVAYLWKPEAIRFYSDRRIASPPIRGLEQEVCAPASNGVIYVENLWLRPRLDVGCLRRRGVSKTRVEQRARGDWIDVWFIPPGARDGR